MLSNQAAYPHLIAIVFVAGVIGLLAVFAQVFLLRRVNRSKLRPGVRICLKVLLWLVFTVVLAAMLHTVVVGTVYAHIDYHFDQIKYGMPIAEVRRSLCWLYEESDISFEDLSKDMSKHDFIIDMRISADEFVEGGLTIEDSKAIAVMMEEAGLDMIHVSVGNYLSVDLNIASSYSGHGWFTDWAKQVKDVVKIPVVTVSRINDPFLADEILASGKADFVAMGRASLCDPGLPNKAKEGRFEDIRRCIGCNDGCEGVLFTDKPFTCVLNPELGHEYEGGIAPAETPLKVAIAGAGPAGLYAAIAATKRGHKVTVFEKKDHNGGNFYTAAIPPTKGEITDFLVWQRVQCEKLGVEIRYNTTATAALIKEGGFDKVIVASGSHPAMPPIPGLKEVSKVTNAQEVLEGRVMPGANCVVIGGGQVGAETAHFLAQLLRNVTILEMLPEIARDAALAVNWHLKESLEKRKVAIHTGVKVLEIKEEGVLYETPDGQQILAPADTIVVATGYRSNEELKQDLDASGIPYIAVGDAVRARKVTAATHEGYEAGKNL